jgi:hypothetical protein
MCVALDYTKGRRVRPHADLTPCEVRRLHICRRPLTTHQRCTLHGDRLRLMPGPGRHCAHTLVFRRQAAQLAPAAWSARYRPSCQWRADRRCVCCEREDVAPITRAQNGQQLGQPLTRWLCPLCEDSIPDEARVRRKETQREPSRTDRLMLKTALYRGQRIIGYRGSRGDDHRWHEQVVLADGRGCTLMSTDDADQ